jgi:hypothetical protein
MADEQPEHPADTDADLEHFNHPSAAAVESPFHNPKQLDRRQCDPTAEAARL